MAVADTAQYPTGMAQSGGLLTGRLSAMMFMQFFVWGAWTVTLGLVMQTVGIGNLIGNAFSVGPIASIVGSFLLGMAAARYVSPRMLMVILHLVGGVLLFVLPSLVTPENGGTFVWLLLCYMILYMPTVGLANTIALKSFGERTDKFPFVRAFGTLGWITAGLIIGWTGLSASPEIFRVAGVVSIALGLYSFTLPNVTADAPRDESVLRQVFCVEAFGLLRQRSFLIFMTCATLISIPLAMYYAYASPYVGDRHQQRRRHARDRADVRACVHVLDAVVVPPVRGEAAAAGRDGGMGVALCFVRDRRWRIVAMGGVSRRRAARRVL